MERSYRTISRLLLLLLCSYPLYGGATFVQQSVGAQNFGSTTFTVAAAASGNVLVLCISTYQSGTETITSLSLTNVTWTKIQAAASSNLTSELWIGTVSGTGGTSLTVNYSTGSFSTSFNLSEWSGVTVTQDGAGQGIGNGTSSVNNNSVTQLTTTTANDLIVAFVGINTPSSTVTAQPSGFTALTFEQDTTFTGTQANYSTSNSVGNISPTWTLSGNANWVSLSVALKSSGGPPAGCANPITLLGAGCK